MNKCKKCPVVTKPSYLLEVPLECDKCNKPKKKVLIGYCTPSWHKFFRHNIDSKLIGFAYMRIFKVMFPDIRSKKKGSKREYLPPNLVKLKITIEEVE